MTDLPTGTVTFLFTDIEGSTKIAHEQREAWPNLQKRHHAILRAAIEANNGYVFQIIGDAFCAAFHTVTEAVEAALACQRALQAEDWGQTPLRVRMGVNSGTAQAEVSADGSTVYSGFSTLVRTQRVMAAAHGGQVLLSNSSAELVRGTLPDETSLRDMGEHRLKGLTNAERIWQLDSAGLRQEFPPLVTLAARPNNLPVQLTSLVGRETEAAEVRGRLSTHRLVTLTGSGGTGKTRLALEVAGEVLDAFKDGVWLIELGPLSDPSLVPNAVAAAVGVREVRTGELMPALVNWMEAKELLLVLDNCEHLIAACAHFADAALHACRKIRILATSREALGIGGESAYRVPSLGTPPARRAAQVPINELAQFTAVRLFVERAGEALSTWSLTAANAPAVAMICSRLDGIPLAIELAAARVRVLSVDLIAERLDDRFRLLTGGGRTALARHQTLRSLIDWSYGLLDERERALLRRLSVFAGGWTLEAAERVCAGGDLQSLDILDVLTSLVDRSMVQVEGAGEASRYRMLETIREYAREKLSESGEETDVQSRHLEFVVSLVQAVEEHGHGPAEREWQDRLEVEIDNLRAALEWAITLEDGQPALALAGPTYWFWWTRGYWHEGYRWLRATLDKAGAEKGTVARSKTLNGLAWFLFVDGKVAEARAAGEESVAICRSLGDQRSLLEALTTLGVSGGTDGTSVENPLLEQVLTLSRQKGYQRGLVLSMIGLGLNRLTDGDEARARAYYEELVQILRDAGDKGQLAFALRQLGYIALRRADARKAIEFCRESLALNLETRDQRGVAACLGAIGSIALRDGQAARAARLYGAATALLDSIGGRLIPVDEAERQPFMLQARGELGEDAFERALAEGRALAIEQALAYALEQAGE